MAKKRLRRTGRQRQEEGIRVNRRNFLKTTGITLAGLTLPLQLTSCEDNTVHLPEVEPPVGTAPVGITRKQNIEEMVRTAIALAGGLEDIHQGDTVVIKPNIMGPDNTFPARIYTHPEVLRAVIRAVKDRTDSSNITVAESSAFNLPTKLWAQQTGIYAVAQDEGVRFLPWEQDVFVTVTSEQFQYMYYDFRIPVNLTDSSFDHFINVPILKNHDQVPGSNVEYTCCIKNHVGIMHPTDRRYKRDTIFETMSLSDRNSVGIHTRNLGEIAAEINLAVPEHTMNIVDALTVVLSGGPASAEMETAGAGLVLASKDRVACDSLAVAVLRHYGEAYGVERPYVDKSVWEQAQISHAQNLNLGRAAENITIVHDGVDNIQDILLKWA